MTKKDVPRMSEADMKELAKGLVEEKVLLMNDCPPELVGTIFMVVGMGCLSSFHLDQVGMVYEWLSKAGDRGINGYPIFTSAQLVHVDDWEIVRARALRIALAIDEAMQ